MSPGSSASCCSRRKATAPAASVRAGVPVEDNVITSPLARTISVSTCPALTKRNAPGRRVEIDQRGRDVLLRRRRREQQLAGPSGQRRQRVGSRPSSARSVACMLLITSEAGRPLPDTSATHSSTALVAASRRTRQHVVVVAAALPGRAVAGGEVVAGHACGSSGREEVRLDAGRQRQLALELRARQLRLAAAAPSAARAPARPVRCARTAARSRSRSRSAAPACSAASAPRPCRPSAACCQSR